MNHYKQSLEELATDFLNNPVNFVAEADLQARLVEILKENLKEKDCDVEFPTFESIPDSYKKKYYEKIQDKLKRKKSIDRVHTEVSIEKNKRFDIVVFKPKIEKIFIRGDDLAGGSKRFLEKDIEAAFELKFIKNKYYVPKKTGGSKKDFDPNYNKIPGDLCSLRNLSEVKNKFLVIFSNFNFFFVDKTSKETEDGQDEIIERSKQARKKLADKSSKNNIDVLYIHPNKPENIGYKDLLLKKQLA